MAKPSNPIAYIGDIVQAIADCEHLGFDHAPDIWRGYDLWKHPITHRGPMIFSAPVLHEDECDILVRHAEEHGDLFTPNEEEGKAYQIDELVLGLGDRELYNQLVFILQSRVTPLFRLMTGHKPSYASSIQLARYTPESTNKTDWHIDEQSELSCIVSLAPERHVGGGTYLRPYGPAGKTIFVPPLQKGHALFFNGRYVYHKGAEVSEGERLLLVYWTMGGKHLHVSTP
jgi:hypothetical protein